MRRPLSFASSSGCQGLYRGVRYHATLWLRFLRLLWGGSFDFSRFHLAIAFSKYAKSSR